MDTADNKFIDSIPPAGEVRDRLLSTLREVHVLRALLKAAESKERSGDAKPRGRKEADRG